MGGLSRRVWRGQGRGGEGEGQGDAIEGPVEGGAHGQAEGIDGEDVGDRKDCQVSFVVLVYRCVQPGIAVGAIFLSLCAMLVARPRTLPILRRSRASRQWTS